MVVRRWGRVGVWRVASGGVLVPRGIVMNESNDRQGRRNKVSEVHSVAPLGIRYTITDNDRAEFRT